MENETQLDLFDDVYNTVEPYHSLKVSLSFQRREGDTTTYHDMTIGNEADYLDHILPVMVEFLQHLGYPWVVGLQAVQSNGNITSTLDD